MVWRLRRIHPLGLGGSCASAWTSAAPHPQTNTQDTREALHPQHSTTSCAAYVHYALCNRTMCLSSVTQARAARARTSDTRDTSHAVHSSRFSQVLHLPTVLPGAPLREVVSLEEAAVLPRGPPQRPIHKQTHRTQEKRLTHSTAPHPVQHTYTMHCATARCVSFIH